MSQNKEVACGECASVVVAVTITATATIVEEIALVLTEDIFQKSLSSA
jgi:hypothetical protein